MKWPRYYDVDGKPLEVLEWAALFEQRRAGGGWWQIGYTEIGEAMVSTVWCGIDHNFFDDGSPLIFETLVRGGPLDGEIERYSTKQEAADGHARWVAAVDQAACEAKR